MCTKNKYTISSCQERKCGIELLRIVAMIAIVSGHMIIHENFESIPLTVNGCISMALTQGSRIAVNCFVLITGYFLNDNTIPFKKIGKVHRQIFFYSLSIFLAMLLVGETRLSIESVISALFPVITSQYWFATTYLMLLLVSPILNYCTANMSRRLHLEFIAIFFVLWSICPTLIIGSPCFSNFGWFVWLYLLAAFIRKYPLNFFDRVRLIHGALLYTSIVAAAVLTFALGYHVGFLRENAKYLFAELNRVPAVLCSTIVFIASLNLNLPNNKYIINIASGTFGVYLIHDNPLIRKLLWYKIFNASQHLESPLFALYAILYICTVFFVGILIDTMRRAVDFQVYGFINRKYPFEKILSKGILRRFLHLFHD